MLVLGLSLGECSAYDRPNKPQPTLALHVTWSLYYCSGGEPPEMMLEG